MLKKGPVNIPQVLQDGEKLGYQFTDEDFGGTTALYWTDFTTAAERKDFDDKLASGQYWWDRWQS